MPESVKWLTREKNPAFPYENTLVEAWCAAGGATLIDRRLPRKLRSAMGHLGFAFGPWNVRRKLVVSGSGRIESVAWPWCYTYEIVPFMWDMWPGYVDFFCKFLRHNRVRLAFCTSRQQTELLRIKNPGVRVEWIPEGVDVKLYPCGEELSKRPVDVLEYGRRKEDLHRELVERSAGRFQLQYQTGRAHLFPDFGALTAGLRRAKISICYPQCDTNPTRAGGVETLTQRYWECMLSGTLICGRAPKELIDLCGYDPVVSVDNASADQIVEVLNSIESWQHLVDRNRKTAERIAGWDKRIPLIMKALEQLT